MRVVFFGTPQLAAEFLNGLLQDSFFEIIAVITQPDESVGRKKILTPPPVKLLALEHGIPVFQPTKLKDSHFIQTVKDLQADAGVVVAYGRILPNELLSVFPFGFINVHPSLLPKYRGPSPIIAAIANGDDKTGVTIMKLVKDMDAGPILAQEVIPLESHETSLSLTEKIVNNGVPLLNKTLKKYLTGSLTPKEQDHSQASFCTLLSRLDGIIDWSQPAEVIERKIRAYNPWPGTSSNNLKIFSVSLSKVFLLPGEQKIDHGRLYIGTGTQALEILELQPAGGKKMLAADYVRGLHL